MNNVLNSEPPTPSHHTSNQLDGLNGRLDTISHQVDRNDKLGEHTSSSQPNAVDAVGAQSSSSVINISSSNGIVIGPMMQYQGEVTIYQNIEASLARPIRPKTLEIQSKFKDSAKAEPICHFIQMCERLYRWRYGRRRWWKPK